MRNSVVYVVAEAGFLSRFLSRSLLCVQRHISVLSASLNNTLRRSQIQCNPIQENVVKMSPNTLCQQQTQERLFKIIAFLE